MTHDMDPKRIADWRDAIQQTLDRSVEQGRFDIIMHYRAVASAFPGEPHAYSFEIKQIDWSSFSDWARALGWDVTFAPENTPPEDIHFPAVRYIRRK